MSRLNQFAPLAILTLALVALLKVGELAIANQFAILPNALAYNLIYASWALMVVGILQLVISRFSPITAAIISGTSLGLLLLSELGLTIYNLHNGFLLGNELFSRPLGESIDTVVATLGWFLPLFIIILVIGGFIRLAFYWSHRQPKHSLWCIALVGILSILGIILKMDHLKVKQHNNFIINKTAYCLDDSWKNFISVHSNSLAEQENEPYFEAIIDSILLTHPEFNPIDKTYPLERIDNTEDILSPFFAESSSLPNIVILVVESLGDEFMNCGLMPFIDTLAYSGLYWKNCLSTTPRSYGAVPAITGSVGGPKSFQFGNMPQHNSLLSILKQGGYTSQAFYTGYFSFDCIYEYLTAQHIDYLSPYFEEYKVDDEKSMSSIWGYHDNILLTKTAAHIAQQSAPTANIIITLTTHEDLNLNDNKLQKQYLAKVKSIAPKLGYSPERLASYRFADDALRQFFTDIKATPQYQNTIFVITGDHGYGYGKTHPAQLHHVPLIIWSPLITQSAKFSNIVTHNDIAPSLFTLLHNRYGLPTPPTVHWLGSGLGSTMPKTLVVVEYDRTAGQLLYHDLFYQAANSESDETLHRILPNFSIREVNDQQLMELCRGELRRMNYLLRYTYRNNRLTSHPVLAAAESHTLMRFCPADFTVVVPKQQPSLGKRNTYTVLEPTNITETDRFKQIEAVLEADVTILSEVQTNDYADLIFTFTGETEIWSGDRISKYLNEPKLIKGHTYHIKVAKTYPLSSTADNALSINIETPSDDPRWHPGPHLRFTHTTVSINYLR